MRRNKKPQRLVFLLLLTIIVLAIIRELLLQQVDLDGHAYLRLLAMQQEVERENIQIQDEILEAEALSTIRRKAFERGFVDTKNYMHWY